MTNEVRETDVDGYAPARVLDIAFRVLVVAQPVALAIWVAMFAPSQWTSFVGLTLGGAPIVMLAIFLFAGVGAVLAALLTVPVQLLYACAKGFAEGVAEEAKSRRSR